MRPPLIDLVRLLRPSDFLPFSLEEDSGTREISEYLALGREVRGGPRRLAGSSALTLLQHHRRGRSEQHCAFWDFHRCVAVNEDLWRPVDEMKGEKNLSRSLVKSSC